MAVDESRVVEGCSAGIPVRLHHLLDLRDIVRVQLRHRFVLT